MKQERDFKGIWIPKDIYLNSELSWTKKILIIEIDSLDDGSGCWAKDKHFSEHLGVAEKTVRNLMLQLKEEGWISTEYDGRERKIFSRCPEKGIFMSRKNDMHVPKKGRSSIIKNTKKDTYKESLWKTGERKEIIDYSLELLGYIPKDKNWYAIQNKHLDSFKKEYPETGVEDFKNYLRYLDHGIKNGAWFSRQKNGNENLPIPTTVSKKLLQHILDHKESHNKSIKIKRA